MSETLRATMASGERRLELDLIRRAGEAARRRDFAEAVRLLGEVGQLRGEGSGPVHVPTSVMR